jgi:RNA polymerase sigma-70 factor (ECF subfamily)
MLTPPELIWLLAGVAKGDEAAFARLYGATRAKLYGIVLRILRRADLADEAMQEAYLHVWRNAGRFDPLRAAPIVWLVAVARRCALDLVRRGGGASGAEAGAIDAAAGARDTLQQPLSDELRRLLACIGQLPPECQRLVLLAYYDGYTREQLAEQIDVPANMVKTWLRRSLLDVRECLDHD